jgi:hypothetical protein
VKCTISDMAPGWRQVASALREAQRHRARASPATGADRCTASPPPAARSTSRATRTSGALAARHLGARATSPCSPPRRCSTCIPTIGGTRTAAEAMDRRSRRRCSGPSNRARPPRRTTTGSTCRSRRRIRSARCRVPSS